MVRAATGTAPVAEGPGPLYVGSVSQSPIRAVLIDCDGTLAPQRMEVTPRVREAVTRLAERVPVGIVSSRDHHDVRWLAAELGFTAPQVSEGGARIFQVGADVEEPLWIKTLAPDDAHSIIEYLDAGGHTFDAVDGNRRVSASADIEDWRLSRVTATALRPDQAEAMAKTMGSKMPGVHAAVIIRTDNGDWIVDFTHAEANKASAAAEFARLLGLRVDQVVGVGDSFNDLPLLEACGLAVAMGQAPPSLKAAADYVAPSAWEDGLAVAIDRFISPRLAPVVLPAEG